MSNTSVQSAKRRVLDYYDKLDTASTGTLSLVQDHFIAADYLWRGFYPFNEMRSADEVGQQFWAPLKGALSHLQRRMDVFMAGQNTLKENGGIWVVSMGHLMGLFDEEWLGIPPSGKIAMLRYCEFHRVEGDKITETAMFFDIPHLMMQVGLQPFPPQTAAHLVQPGPMTHNGLMFEEQEPEQGLKTIAAIDYMVSDIRNWRGGVEEPLVEELRRSWNEDMIWWGPAGIGATYTIERYAQQHAGPFRAALTDRTFNGHICTIAEGHFGGFFGWPNLTLTASGGFMGMPATNTPSDMRVIDIYRRDGDKLTENWIFIDLLHFWNMQGIDVLARTTGINSSKETGASGMTL